MTSGAGRVVAEVVVEVSGITVIVTCAPESSPQATTTSRAAHKSARRRDANITGPPFVIPSNANLANRAQTTGHLRRARLCSATSQSPQYCVPPQKPRISPESKTQA